MKMPQDPLPTVRRTIWAEHEIEDFLALPLIHEFVYRSPQFLDGPVQKEVVDYLVYHGNTSIFLSLKCQENPSDRTGEKVAAWARKAAQKAVSQLCGALRTGMAKPIKPMWCEHPRRGRVEFPNGLPRIDYAIALIEVFERVDLEHVADRLPLKFQGTPIAYFSLNDFLNLVLNLRSTTDLLAYLHFRSSLSPSELRIIGAEKSLFEYYLLEGAPSRGPTSRADAQHLVNLQPKRLMEVIEEKIKNNRYSGLIEGVANALAERLPNYDIGIPKYLLENFDPPHSRVNYLKMQEFLAELRIGERIQLGQAFESVITELRLKTMEETKGLLCKAMLLNSRPDWVFLFASSKGFDRVEVLQCKEILVSGAMGHYNRNCFAVIDRDSEGLEVKMGMLNSPPTQSELELGQRLFGKLKVISRDSLLGI